MRRLQLAENESRYPAALWEVNLFRSFLLETEVRFEEALQSWRDLSEAAAGSYFGHIARDRAKVLANATTRAVESSLQAEFA